MVLFVYVLFYRTSTNQEDLDTLINLSVLIADTVNGMCCLLSALLSVSFSNDLYSGVK
jgi:hypothetical protein